MIGVGKVITDQAIHLWLLRHSLVVEVGCSGVKKKNAGRTLKVYILCLCRSEWHKILARRAGGSWLARIHQWQSKRTGMQGRSRGNQHREAVTHPSGSQTGDVAKMFDGATRANEFIDFMELPPTRGKSRPITQDLEGRVLVVQAADLAQSRKLIPDLATWLQCFALYAAAVLQEQQERAAKLMAYQSIIAKASLRYKWPSWVIYDMSFRQEMAGVTGVSWARVDLSIYSLCFTGQAICNENWCPTCQT